MDDETELRPILHILVVGFHHQKGSTIEYSHPPLPVTSQTSRAEEQSITTSVATSRWRNLPHLALPDGCHNYEKESVYFVLPHLSDPDKCVYGIACCRQIDVQSLTHISKDVTRSTVQKSICVISQYPVFGFIEAKLDLVTHTYFNGKDFSDVKILDETYENLNIASSDSFQVSPILHIGLSQRDLVIHFHHRLLQIFKAILLQKRVIVYGSLTKNVCNTILSMVSLVPYSLEGLIATEKEKECALPLSVFSANLSFLPYVCLQQMEVLVEPSSTFILAGVVNPLFEKQHSKLSDVFVNMSDGHITVNKPFLSSALHLTAADLRFCSLLSETVCNEAAEEVSCSDTLLASSHPDWLGSNEWILVQFKLYILSLLKTSLHGEESARNEFNSEFMAVWLKSRVYSSWLEVHETTTTEPKACKHSDNEVEGKKSLFETIEPTHVCSGELSVSDLKRRLVAQASDYGLNVQSREQVVQQTQQVIAQATERVTNVVSRAWNSASSAVYSWWGGKDEGNNENV